MRCADRRPQGGAAIILALVTVLFAAIVAAAVIANLGRSIDSATGLQDQHQARMLARGAADWARNVLADDGRRTAADHLGEPWAVKVPPTPIDQGDTSGEVAGEIQDWSGRFNVNNLAPGGKPDLAMTARFARLLEALGLSQAQAAQRAQQVLAWISAAGEETAGGEAAGVGATLSGNAARAPHGPLAHLDELRKLPEFDPALLAQLAEVAVALPAPSRINVNTAPVEVLFALTSGLELDAAQVLAAERARAWFKDVADFSARLPAGASADDPAKLDVRSRHFLVTGRARFGVSVVSMEVLLDRKDTWPEILWQRIP